jgi:hypothetical protein
MSALLPKADIGERNWDVRFGPKADIAAIGCQAEAHCSEPREAARAAAQAVRYQRPLDARSGRISGDTLKSGGGER